MKKIIIGMILVVFALHVSAQGKHFKNEGDVMAFSKKQTELFMDNKIPRFFDELTDYWPMPQDELETMEKETIELLNKVHERYGKTIGMIKTSDQKILDFAIRETYLVRHEKAAIRLVYTYYKNDKGWYANSFEWDDAFDEELE